MWKRGGRSSALDRAQALLSAKRNSRGDAESVQPTAETQDAVVGSAKSRPAPPNTHTLLSDVSDLSSVSSAPEHGADTGASAAAAAAAGAAAGKTQGRERDTTKDLRPQSSLGGGGSRFLKKAPTPATNSSQSPVSRRQIQQVAEPRNVSSSLRGSQTAALNRLAQIESRIRSRQLAGQGPKSAENLTSDLGVSPPPAAQSTEASVQLPAQSNHDQSLKGTRFLKNHTAVNNSNPAAAVRAPQGPDVGVRSRSRAADAVVPSVGLETKSVRVVRGVSLESDEEDMRKLLGDSDSTDNSFLIPARPSSKRTADKMLSKSSQRVHSTPPPAAVPPSSSPVNTAPPRSPSCSSPFRFTGQAQAHFSPSVLSPSPSPPSASPSPPGRLDFPHRMGSPQRSLSSMSRRSEVLSLEELFPVGPDSEDPHNDMSAVSSEDGQQDFKLNVLTLDDLVPANPGFTEETHEREARLSTLVPGSLNRRALPRLKEKDEDQQQAEDVLGYQSDFESESRTDPGYSASQVSEHLQGHGDEEEVASEVRQKASDSDVSRGTAEDDYSDTFSDTSRSYISQTSDRSQTLSRSRDSRSSVSYGSRNSSRQSRRRASTRNYSKDAAVQTYTQPAGMATVGSAARMTYMDPTPMVTHTLSAEMVEALSTFNPAVFALNELLKQQLAMTRRFIESSRHLHSSLVQSLEPPSYRYTTLEDTKEYIRKHRPPKLTMEDALEEVLQEMRDC